MRFQRFGYTLWLAAAGAAFAADSRTVAGEYVCVLMGSRPCDTSTQLQLAANGKWTWARYNGTFTVSGDSLTFDGVGGLAGWGPATLGLDSLTFTSGNRKVVWKKPSSAASAGLAPGTYYCQTAPGGCQTGKGIEIAADGTWSWGGSGGSYSVVGGRVIFNGPQVSGWGPADIAGGKLVFRSRSGDSEWSSTPSQSGSRQAASTESKPPASSNRPAPVNRPAVDPNQFELGCPLLAFDRQRVQASIQDALADGASVRTKQLAHEQLAEMCRKVGDPKRADRESLRAEYWRNGGR